MRFELPTYEDMLSHYRRNPMPHKGTLMSVMTSKGLLIPLLFDTITLPMMVGKTQQYMAEDPEGYKETLFMILRESGYETVDKLRGLAGELTADVFTLFDFPMALRTYVLREPVKTPKRSNLDILRN